MYKITGAALIMASSVYAGIATAAFFKARVRSIESLYRLIVHISEQIESYLTPVDVILKDYEDKHLEKTGFIRIAAEKGGAEAVEKCRRQLFLSNSETDDLKTFFDLLGHGTAAQEIRHCRCYEKRFSQLLTNTQGELQKRTRISYLFGLLGGIMAVVLLL